MSKTIFISQPMNGRTDEEIRHAGLMGLPIPAAITKAIDILKQRAETPEKGKN